MQSLRVLWFVLKMRWRHGAKISLGASLKGVARITIGSSAKVHVGAVVDASRGGPVVLGRRVTLNRQVSLQGGRGGICLGDGVEINSLSMIDGTGGVEIGAGTLIGPGVCVISYQHQFSGRQPIREQSSVAEPIVIGRDVWVGANAVVLAGVRIGEGAVVGAGAVVTCDVPDWAVVVGIPARIAKWRNAVSVDDGA